MPGARVAFSLLPGDLAPSFDARAAMVFRQRHIISTTSVFSLSLFKAQRIWTFGYFRILRYACFSVVHVLSWCRGLFPWSCCAADHVESPVAVLERGD